MKMFILGAIVFYLISCIIAETLEEFRIVDLWDFAEYYFAIPLLPFVLIVEAVKKLVSSGWLIRYGVNPFGKMNQLDEMSTEKLEDIYERCKDDSNGKVYIEKILREREDNAKYTESRK